MCAVRPVKAAGAKPWIRPWGEKPGRARCTPKEQSVYEARRARDPAPEEPDVTHRWSTAMCCRRH